MDCLHHPLGMFGNGSRSECQIPSAGVMPPFSIPMPMASSMTSMTSTKPIPPMPRMNSGIPAYQACPPVLGAHLQNQNGIGNKNVQMVQGFSHVHANHIQQIQMQQMQRMQQMQQWTRGTCTSQLVQHNINTGNFERQEKQKQRKNDDNYDRKISDSTKRGHGKTKSSNPRVRNTRVRYTSTTRKSRQESHNGSRQARCRRWTNNEHAKINEKMCDLINKHSYSKDKINNKSNDNSNDKNNVKNGSDDDYSTIKPFSKIWKGMGRNEKSNFAKESQTYLYRDNPNIDDKLKRTPNGIEQHFQQIIDKKDNFEEQFRYKYDKHMHGKIKALFKTNIE